MSKTKGKRGNSRLLYSFVAIISLFVAGTIFFTYSRSEHRHQQNRDAYSEAKANASSDEGYSACFVPFSASDTADCIADKINAYTTAYKEQNDLNAQQDMELWAFGAFMFTGLSLVMTGIGAVLIWQTHIESRHIGQAQTRAYLAIGGGKYNIAQSFLTINLRVRNVGNSPAYGVTIATIFTVNVVRRGTGTKLPSFEKIEFATKPEIIGDIQAGGERPCTIYYHGGSARDAKWDSILDHIDSKGNFGLNVEAVWVDVFDEKCAGSAKFWCKWDSEIDEEIDDDHVLTIQGGLIEEDGRIN